MSFAVLTAGPKRWKARRPSCLSFDSSFAAGCHSTFCPGVDCRFRSSRRPGSHDGLTWWEIHSAGEERKTGRHFFLSDTGTNAKVQEAAEDGVPECVWGLYAFVEKCSPYDGQMFMMSERRESHIMMTTRKRRESYDNENVTDASLPLPNKSK